MGVRKDFCFCLFFKGNFQMRKLCPFNTLNIQGGWSQSGSDTPLVPSSAVSWTAASPQLTLSWLSSFLHE